ncbi:hypothetical protein [Pseudoalteromonas sp. T1lg48]|uniref:hypothetical protein n=1 Tax=Pseudoalteromonas sp. T1lg48 TaxID=2077100 RepID=UPI000CF66E30|nr:hypothetical protein [Pseudoalteromonas sp. T1lg48]
MSKSLLKKLWYSLDEASNILDCSRDFLIHLGITGQIQIGFDWVIQDQIMRKFDLESGYRFSIDSEPYHTCDKPNYVEEPHKRIAFLSGNNIAHLARNGSIKAPLAQLEGYSLSLSAREYCSDTSPAVLEMKDLVILGTTLKTLKLELSKSSVDTGTQAGIVMGVEEDIAPPTPTKIPHQHKKEMRTVLKLLGAAIKYIAAGQPSTFYHGQNINYSKVEESLQPYYPDDQTGLGDTNARKKISEALRLHDE